MTGEPDEAEMGWHWLNTQPSGLMLKHKPSLRISVLSASSVTVCPQPVWVSMPIAPNAPIRAPAISLAHDSFKPHPVNIPANQLVFF